MKYNPGDAILLNRGDTFEGQILDTLHGSPSSPIVIGAYGSGAKPIIYGDLRGRTWTKISGRTGYYQAYVGGYSEIINEPYYQYYGGAWITSTSTAYRGSNPTGWSAWLDSLKEGGYGTDLQGDTVFIHTFGSVPFPTVGDSLRMYRYSSKIYGGSNGYIIRDLDLRNVQGGLIAYGKNGTVRNISTKSTLGSGLIIQNASHVLMDSCVVDSCGDTGIYVINDDTCTVRYNTVTNVLVTINGIVGLGTDRCGIGILDNYNASQNSCGYNTVEYNTLYNILNAFTDWYFCIGDTVRYNIGHGAKGGASPNGKNIVVTHNTFTGFPAGFDGSNISLLENGNITYTYNTLDSVSDYGIFVSENDSGGTVTINNNTISVNNTIGTFINFGTAPGITSTQNHFYGPGRWVRNNVLYTTLSAFQAAAGYDAGSSWYSSAGAPTGTITATPDSLPLAGGTVMLQWTSTMATSAFISYKIGNIDTVIDVDTAGSRAVNVSAATTFVLTLIGPFGTTTLSASVIVGATPAGYSLEQNYPNPFNISTTIGFELPIDENVSLKVFDINGRTIAILVEGMLTRGTHSIQWNPKRVASGVYRYRLTAGSNSKTLRMVIVR